MNKSRLTVVGAVFVAIAVAIAFLFAVYPSDANSASWVTTGKVSTFISGTTSPVSAPGLTVTSAGFNTTSICNLTVCASTGNLVSGGGVSGYVWTGSLWSRYPAADATVGGGYRCVTGADVNPPAGFGKRDYSSTVSVSGGNTVYYYVKCK